MSVADELPTTTIMLIIFCLALIVSASCLDSRIIGGTNTSISNVPYQVSIHKNDKFHCGGSIIHQKWILTAAHCVNDGPSSVFSVRVGSIYHDEGGTLIRGIASIIYHENFDDTTYNYDVALIKLSKVLKFGTNVKAVLLALPSAPVPSTSAIVAGWGKTSPNGKSSKILQSVTVPIIKQESCQKSYLHLRPVTLNMLCAGNEKKDACKGDSGGALVYYGVQIGIVSWGARCASVGYPGVYTRVSAIRQWITKHTNV